MYIFQAWLTFKELEAKRLINQYFMSTDIQAPQEASAETQEILKELQEEGHQIEGLSPEEPKEEPKADPQPKKEEEKPEAKPEEKPEEKESEKKPDQKDQPTVDRTTKAVPVGKYNDERHKRQEVERLLDEERKAKAELEAKINTISNQPNKQELEDVREAAKKIAEKHGFEDSDFIVEFADTMVALASKRNVLPQEIENKLKAFDEMKAKQEAQAIEQAQEVGFNSELETVIKEFPDLVAHKDELKQLAFMEGNEKVALRRLAIEYMHDNPVQGRKTAESPLPGRTGAADIIDFDNMTEAQLKDLTGEQLDQYLAHLDKKSKY